MCKFHVILDNGHGKETKGKRSPLWKDGTQLLEYSYTRDIVDRIINSLKADSTTIVLHRIVPEENDIPLKERAARANKISLEFGKTNCLGISVHVNAFNSEARGWEIHTFLGESLSDRYAEIFWRVFSQNPDRVLKMRKSSETNLDKDSNFAILRDTLSPFLLTENGFMDEEEECKYLLSEEGRSFITKCHVDAIKACYNYWKKCKSMEGFVKGDIRTDNF